MFSRSPGFTLVEIMVVVAIIGILAATVSVYALRGSATSRDAKRQADLKLLQAAVEAYKVDNGRYPPGCNAAGSWSGEVGTSFECSGTDKRFIVGLAPKYIRSLPRDPNRGNCKDTTSPFDCGYAYVTNAEGSVYKIIAMNTVESEVVTPAHQLASCDVTGVGATDIRRDQNGDGWCGALLEPTLIQTENTTGHRCNVGSDRFRSSYAVWAGFAAPVRYCDSGGRCIKPATDPTVDPLEDFEGTYTDAQKRNLRPGLIANTTAIICS